MRVLQYKITHITHITHAIERSIIFQRILIFVVHVAQFPINVDFKPFPCAAFKKSVVQASSIFCCDISFNPLILLHLQPCSTFI